MFQTPFRTPHGEVNATPSRTPMIMSSAHSSNNQLALMNSNGVPQSPSVTTIRDKLSINPEDGLSGFEDKARQVLILNFLFKNYNFFKL